MDPETPPHVPYQAYKPKRHSRNISNPHLVPNVSPPPPRSRPSSFIGSPSSTPLKLQESSTPGPSPVNLPSQANGNGVKTLPFSNGLASMTNPEELVPNGSIPTLVLPDPVPLPAESVSLSEGGGDHPGNGVSPEDPAITGLTVNGSTEAPIDTTSGPFKSEFPESTSSPSSPNLQPTSIPSTVRETSTFRRLAPRAPSTRPPLPSSPLRTSSVGIRSFESSPRNTIPTFSPPTHNRTVSANGPGLRTGETPRPRISSLSSAPVIQPSLAATAMQIRQPSDSSRNDAPTPRMTSTNSFSSSPASHPPSPTTANISNPINSTTPMHAPAPSNTSSPSSVTSRSRVTTPRPAAPYRPGFQPKGVYRPRTDEYIAYRRERRDVGRVERTKLERRLEKLIQLHFGDSSSEKSTGGGSKSEKGLRPPGNRRASSFFDLHIDPTNLDAGGLWRGMMGKGGKSERIREAEQRITPWQEDASAAKCPLCTTPFHPLTNRKHHCRLCGQIICSLPPKRPLRPVSCSLLFIADPKTHAIEEVGEGVDYGVRGIREEEKFLKGVRVCRECRPVLLRQQYRQEFSQLPAFVRLYDAFIILEKEIEDSLPQFQELILSLGNDAQPSKEASTARKRLLEAFAQYDALSKRIRSLPAGGESQQRVQAAIVTRANLFLQKNMFPLQSLPKPQLAKTTKSEGEAQAPPDPDSETARVLQPLLEQEALLESFVEEAKAQRKFEDVKTLRANLKEIRAEIVRVLDNAEVGMGRGAAK